MRQDGITEPATLGQLFRAKFNGERRFQENHLRYRVVTPANSNTPGGEAA